MDEGVWDVVGLEGGRQRSTASWMAELSAVAAVLRYFRMDALLGVSAGEKW